MIGGPRARARNSSEMRFFVSLQDCPTCKHRLDPARFDYGGDVGTGAALSGKCDHCLTPIGFGFLGDDLSKGAIGRWDELAPGRTEILAPSKLASELDRLGPEILDDPTQLTPVDWQINRDLNKRAVLCAHELAKLLDDGADAISDELLDIDERAQRAAHPQWYQRAWIEGRLARHRAIVQANVADLPRMNELEAQAAKRRPKGVA